MSHQRRHYRSTSTDDDKRSPIRSATANKPPAPTKKATQKPRKPTPKPGSSSSDGSWSDTSSNSSYQTASSSSRRGKRSQALVRSQSKTREHPSTPQYRSPEGMSQALVRSRPKTREQPSTPQYQPLPPRPNVPVTTVRYQGLGWKYEGVVSRPYQSYPDRMVSRQQSPEPVFKGACKTCARKAGNCIAGSCMCAGVCCATCGAYCQACVEMNFG